MSMLAFAASHRPTSLNASLLRCAMSLLEEDHGDITLCHTDFADMDTPYYNDHLRETQPVPRQVESLRQLWQAVDSAIIATPEYNWSYPGNLKTMIDWLSCFTPNILAGKPVMILCATPSEQGGVMGTQALKSTLGGWLGMHVYPTPFVLNAAHTQLDNNMLSDSGKTEYFRAQLAAFMEFRSRFV